MTKNLEHLKQIVGKQLGIDPKKIRADADFGRELGADSLDVVELLMTMENEFGLDIEDTVAGEIATIQDVLDYMEKNLD